MSLFAVLLASLLGSLHCAGMCGGFVAFYSGNCGKSLYPHFAYNIGRLTTYLMLGAIAGIVGRSVNLIGNIAGFQRFAAIFAGALLIVWGLKGLLFKKTFSASHSDSMVYRAVKKCMSFVFSQDIQGNWVPKAFLVGAVSTWLPCGFLYMYLAVAAATADPLSAMLVMFFFWIGTLPVMASVAGLANVMSWRLRHYAPVLTSILLVLAGLFAIGGHLEIFGSHAHHHHHH